jgi:sulfate permease, SulP family
VTRASLRVGAGEVSGAVADLGVFVPLVAALVLVNGLDAGTVLVVAGGLVVISGLAFRVPFPVQPLKALTAVSVALGLGADVIHAAGLLIGGFLLLLSFRGAADLLARVFTKPVVRALQLGVGVLLVLAAYQLVAAPPEVFTATPASPWPVLLGVGALAVVAFAAQRGRYGLAAGLLGAGVLAALLLAPPSLPGPQLALPGLSLPPMGVLGTAFVLLVVPQLPLTFGNAVVAVTDVAHGYFGKDARRVTPARVCVSAGVANIASALLGGMPMCHGSGGLTAHYRLGARTVAMSLLLGGAFIGLGLFFGPHVLALFGLLPVWALAAFLAYAGARHALLVIDLRGMRLAVAVAAGLTGALLANLFVTAVVALTADVALRSGVRLLARVRRVAA